MAWLPTVICANVPHSVICFTVNELTRVDTYRLYASFSTTGKLPKNLPTEDVSVCYSTDRKYQPNADQKVTWKQVHILKNAACHMIRMVGEAKAQILFGESLVQSSCSTCTKNIVSV